MAGELAFDQIGAPRSATVGAVMVLYDMGVLKKEQLGIEAPFGSAKALVHMVEITAKGEGFGKELGMGSMRLTAKYGHPELFMGVKGQEFAGYDSRALQGMGLGYATSNRGACHLKHDVFGEDMEDISGNNKAQPVKDSQDRVAMIVSTGLCLFTTAGWGDEDYVAQLDAACEGSWTKERCLESGERTWTLERMFNMRAGLTGADDSLPKRLLEDPAPSGNAKGKVAELGKMLPEYYAVRGWTTEGMPTNETLNRLAL